MKVVNNLHMHFDVIDDEISDLNWYSLTICTTKMLPIIMCGTDVPVVLKGFGGTKWNREQFTRVKHSNNISNSLYDNINFN